MAAQVGAWVVREGGLARLEPATDYLEKHLEAWIEGNPEVLPGSLTIVGRQVHTEGGPLDLLAIDPQGRWVVIELKATRLSRDVVTQAMDYAACIDQMPKDELERRVDEYLSKKGGGTLAELMKDRQGDTGDEAGSRDIRLLVAGVGQDSHLTRLLKYLGKNSRFGITQVSFQLFSTSSGETVLVRELTEADSAGEARSGPVFSEESVLEMADAAGLGSHLRSLVEVAREGGLPVKAWKTSLMFTPPSNRTRCLITVWGLRDKHQNMALFVAGDAFEELLGIPATTVEGTIGNDWVSLPLEEVPAFVTKLRNLLGAVDQPGRGATPPEGGSPGLP